MSQFDTAVAFNAAATGLVQRGITSNTSQSINSGATFDLDITINKSTYKYGRILIRRQSGVILPQHFCIIWCNSTTAKGQSFSNAGSSGYLVAYSMAQGDSYLSHQMFSSASDGVRVENAYITSTTLRITFYNAAGVSKTLNAYVDWEVWEG